MTLKRPSGNKHSYLFGNGGKSWLMDIVREHPKISISCLGLALNGFHLMIEFLEIGNLPELLQHLTSPSLLFLHIMTYLSIPSFMLIGHFYQKQKNLVENLERIVEEKTRKLKEAERLATIGETAAMVGHDLRNPLQVIVSTLYLANMKTENPLSGTKEREHLKEHLKTIEEQTLYMDKIVSDLQDYARLVNPEVVPTSIRQLINDITSRMTIPENVEVTVAIPDGFPKLKVDPALMRRVFTNLVTNAVQAMPDGGKLTIKGRRTDEDAYISVGDTGVGIPEQYLDKLFKPLFTTKSRGQGLGLAVCKRLVEAHKGSITVCSQEGEGSTFTVKMPLSEEA